MHLLMLATFYNIKEKNSIISIVFNIKLGLVKLIFLINIVFWQINIILFNKLQ